MQQVRQAARVAADGALGRQMRTLILAELKNLKPRVVQKEFKGLKKIGAEKKKTDATAPWEYKMLDEEKTGGARLAV